MDFAIVDNDWNIHMMTISVAWNFHTILENKQCHNHKQFPVESQTNKNSL